MTSQDQPQLLNRALRRRVGTILTLMGLFLFILGADPGLFGLDRSLPIGVLQVNLISLGLLVICLGGTVTLDALWPRDTKTIIAEIGIRLAWTGFVVAAASGMADVIGLGTRQITETVPFFGFWQARGVLIGEIVMIVGFFMMIPYSPPKVREEE